MLGGPIEKIVIGINQQQGFFSGGFRHCGRAESTMRAADGDEKNPGCRRWFKTRFFVGAKLDRFQREMAENRGPC
jgi:hypothetical protein